MWDIMRSDSFLLIIFKGEKYTKTLFDCDKEDYEDLV